MSSPTQPRDPSSRVVITGVGAITPVGNSVAETWASLVNGRSGIETITQFDYRQLPVHIAGEIKDFNPRQYIEPKDARRMSRSSQLVVATLSQVMADAALPYPLTGEMAERTGVYMGTSMGHWDKAEQGFMEYLKGGPLKTSPFSIPASSPNLAAFHLCVRLNAQGYTNTVATACSAGTVAIAEAAEVIKRGRCEMMIAGGAEANINLTTIAGFVAMRGLSTLSNDDPARASRPFDAKRDGFILSE
ncbi:MAG TPA: beta-ketoacyl synthase N-terminal-like domain-containing protein, partial [Anaerolineae bacterium]|nr:beta-ketoacyl synthase N-terminal-like domain-containing protein [Anaerolineae bacterium]